MNLTPPGDFCFLFVEFLKTRLPPPPPPDCPQHPLNLHILFLVRPHVIPHFYPPPTKPALLLGTHKPTPVRLLLKQDFWPHLEPILPGHLDFSSSSLFRFHQGDWFGFNDVIFYRHPCVQIPNTPPAIWGFFSGVPDGPLTVITWEKIGFPFIFSHSFKVPMGVLVLFLAFFFYSGLVYKIS